MQVIFAGISILIFFVTIVNLSTLTLSGWLKAAIIIPLILKLFIAWPGYNPKKQRRKIKPTNSVSLRSPKGLTYPKTTEFFMV